MKIASLVPSATEILGAIGLIDDVIAVTHECDHPPAAATKPHLTRTVLAPGLTSAETDAEVKRVTAEGRALYELDEERLEELGPDLIVTQAVCEVCAVSIDDVRAVASRLTSAPAVLSLDPSTLGDVLGDIGRVGAACGAANEAASLRRSLEERVEAVRSALAGCERVPVLALEWLAPPFTGGHWIPEMIAIAGGSDIAASPGERSREAGWDELGGMGAEVVVVMPCGWNAERAADEADAHADELAALGADRIHAVDAAASFSRPGPRLIDGVELLAQLLHPDRVDPPAGISHRRVA